MIIFGLDVWVFCFVAVVVGVASFIIGGMMRGALNDDNGVDG